MPPGLESPPGTPAPIRLEGLFTINGGVWGDMNIVGGQADYQFSFPMEVFLGHAGTVEDPYPISGSIKGSVFVDNQY